MIKKYLYVIALLLSTAAINTIFSQDTEADIDENGTSMQENAALDEGSENVLGDNNDTIEEGQLDLGDQSAEKDRSDEVSSRDALNALLAEQAQEDSPTDAQEDKEAEREALFASIEAQAQEERLVKEAVGDAIGIPPVSQEEEQFAVNVINNFAKLNNLPPEEQDEVLGAIEDIALRQDAIDQTLEDLAVGKAVADNSALLAEVPADKQDEIATIAEGIIEGQQEEALANIQSADEGQLAPEATELLDAVLKDPTVLNDLSPQQQVAVKVELEDALKDTLIVGANLENVADKATDPETVKAVLQQQSFVDSMITRISDALSYIQESAKERLSDKMYGYASNPYIAVPAAVAVGLGGYGLHKAYQNRTSLGARVKSAKDWATSKWNNWWDKKSAPNVYTNKFGIKGKNLIGRPQ